ncbi:MAG: ATP-binding cassette domain-containing protein [Desulfatitalea sp.]|nr:dynamin family protein [Desulfatitalea sp.]NNJ99879.1 ATP-binding cassette domain-containing protein [Desulfatitalea sp.]
MRERDLYALDAIGQIETHLQTLDSLDGRLERVPLWLPARGLRRQADEARRMIDGMRTRLERRVVVTLIGPSGAGKSTLLNALAGEDELSPTGHDRPTTRRPVVLCDDPAEVDQLLGPLDETQVQVRISHGTERLRHILLVDTPDTDSTQQAVHLPLIREMVARSDVLLCVFDARNPKRRDHADLMAPMVRQFHGASLVAVVNQCDRLDHRELTETIAPDFEAYLADAWPILPQAILLVSARRHLQQPRWDPQALPRHDFDQFAVLRDMLVNTFGRPGFGPDRRLANARQIQTYLTGQIRREARQDRDTLAVTARQITAARQQALKQAVEGLQRGDQRMALGVHARLYQALAQRWTGPVGWLVAAWSRLILFGSGLAALVRFGNPLRQLWGLVASWRQYRKSSTAIAALTDSTRINSAQLHFQRTWLTLWPAIAERLITARFDASVREVHTDADAGTGSFVHTLWADALDAEIERRADALSRFPMQLLFNLPSLALLAYAGWLTTSRFLSRDYLTGDFFLHALVTLVLVMLLSFFLLQMAVRLTAGRNPIQQRAFQVVAHAISDCPATAAKEVAEQVARVMALGEKIDA